MAFPKGGTNIEMPAKPRDLGGQKRDEVEMDSGLKGADGNERPDELPRKLKRQL